MHDSTRRLTLLRNVVSLLRTLQSEMPGSAILIGQAIRSVSVIAENYEQQERELAELHASSRKPPQRVPMRARRKSIGPAYVSPNETLPACKHCSNPVRGPHELTCGSDACLEREYGGGPMNGNVDEENQG